MGEKAARIERHIEQQRSDCRDNMIELKQRVGRSFDWRVQCEERPMTMVGAAFIGGVLLSTLVDGRSRSGPQTVQEHADGGAWDVLKGALVGMAASRLVGFVEELLPGFLDEYRKHDRRPSR